MSQTTLAPEGTATREPSGILAFENVTRVFRTGLESHTALDDVSLTLQESQRIGIIGESGSGKSTLVRMALGLDRPTSGRVLYQGRDIHSFSQAEWLAYRRAIQWIGQDTGGAFNPRWTIRKSMMRVNTTLCGLTAKDAKDRMESLTVQMGLDAALLDRKPAALSGGQRQRFAIVRAVIPEPKVLLADEAVSALDVSVQGTVLNLLKEYCDTADCALMFVSHGLPTTAFMTHDVVVMKNGVVVEHGPTRRVLEEPEHDYTRQLVDAYTYDA
ncbi:ABC transporter ATP-binding protein [Frondihabitans australicus]|uniref:Peptide/nickel transport system ATP-binding protein n=1 Tax=Frondihabitans australicus TaxID=386892 RepID=A0A495IEJ8_9MICO|nr:dipeptide/oligopeptide/nickel ABC transporter ATP-binding protein [Frondihabitans australicus]RKR73436.1 peptide/nickel transport system ATP-binding protein [Frondihabitans australicus]